MLLKADPSLKLPTPKDLPDSDDTPVDNELQDLIPGLLKSILAMIWPERMDWFFGVDMGIYYEPEEPAIVPDGFLSIGVPRIIDENLRLSYVLWEEQKLPILILEVVSQKRRGEYTTKKAFYQEMGILYYVIYNPLRRRKSPLEVYKLIDGNYQLLPGQIVWLEEIGLSIGESVGLYQGLERKWLFWYDQSENRYLSPEESVRQAREELQKVKQQAYNLILNILTAKLGRIPAPTQNSINRLNQEKLNELAVALLNFSELIDLQRWLENLR